MRHETPGSRRERATRGPDSGARIWAKAQAPRSASAAYRSLLDPRDCARQPRAPSRPKAQAARALSGSGTLGSGRWAGSRDSPVKADRDERNVAEAIVRQVVVAMIDAIVSPDVRRNPNAAMPSAGGSLLEDASSSSDIAGAGRGRFGACRSCASQLAPDRGVAVPRAGDLFGDLLGVHRVKT
jgi:hypothetical protein